MEEKKVSFFSLRRPPPKKTPFSSPSHLARVARVHPLHVFLHERDVLVVALPPRVAVERARVAEGVLAARELFFCFF